MRVAIGSDHAGFELKEAVKTFLAAEHHDIVDVGTHSPDPVDYPEYAQALGAAVRESRAERGILIKPFASRALPNHLRIGVGRPEDTDAVFRALLRLAHRTAACGACCVLERTSRAGCRRARCPHMRRRAKARTMAWCACCCSCCC